MKRLSFLVAVGAGCLLFQSVQATLLFSDGFNYTPSDDLGAGSTTPPWTASGTPTSYMSIGGANLTYSGLQDLGGNDLILNNGSGAGIPAYAALTAQSGVGTSVYYSFLIECTALPTSNSYLGGLTPSSHLGPNGNGSDAIDTYARNLSTGWQLGVRTTGVSANYETTQLALNTVYFAVYEYTFNASSSTASFWLNPVPGASQPVVNQPLTGYTETGTAAVSDISGFGFKSQATGAVGNFIIDNVMVGTTWADVTPVGVPEPATFALAGLGMLGLVLARRMRR